MTDEEIIKYVNEKFKTSKNKINSVKEVFSKKINEENNFEEIFFNIMEDYVLEKIKKK